MSDVEAEIEARPSIRQGGSRIGSVAGALRWRGCSQPSATARLLDRLFEEVLLVGGRPPVGVPGHRLPQPDDPDAGLPSLAAALAATDAERVVYVSTDGPSLTVDLLLALTAWPEVDAVVVGEAAGKAGGDVPPLCAIHRRAACLVAARARIAEGRRTLQDLFDSVETTRLSLARLGVAESDAELPTHLRAPGDRVRLEDR